MSCSWHQSDHSGRQRSASSAQIPNFFRSLGKQFYLTTTWTRLLTSLGRVSVTEVFLFIFRSSEHSYWQQNQQTIEFLDQFMYWYNFVSQVPAIRIAKLLEHLRNDFMFVTASDPPAYDDGSDVGLFAHIIADLDPSTLLLVDAPPDLNWNKTILLCSCSVNRPMRICCVAVLENDGGKCERALLNSLRERPEARW